MLFVFSKLKTKKEMKLCEFNHLSGSGLAKTILLIQQNLQWFSVGDNGIRILIPVLPTKKQKENGFLTP